jgi:hypothetical protein
MPRGVSRYDEARLQGRLWTPRHVGGDLRFWHQADAMDTLTMSSGAVSAWADIGRSGRDWVQATGTNQPTWTVGGWDGVRPSLSFDGTSDHLRMTVTAIAQPFTAILVARRTSTPFAAHMIEGVSSGNRVILGGSDGSSQSIIFAGASLGGQAIDTLPRVFAGIYNGASSFNIIDGATVSSGNVGSNTWADQYMFLAPHGGTFRAVGHVFATCLVAGASRAVADRLTGYFAWASGLQARLAASHPYRNAPPLIGG